MCVGLFRKKSESGERKNALQRLQQQAHVSRARISACLRVCGMWACLTMLVCLCENPSCTNVAQESESNKKVAAMTIVWILQTAGLQAPQLGNLSGAHVVCSISTGKSRHFEGDHSRTEWWSGHVSSFRMRAGIFAIRIEIRKELHRGLPRRPVLEGGGSLVFFISPVE